ncbi:MAG TPA: hypothetical protein DHW61_01555 [Lachnoclostridium phytofermentans]|uniref:Uncharacterized protein n=1 Tax=Lachnoclostridium phytofermentans TaxID=66219 RepID=A0A3D2X396_9FIRM|nr:hypothetical protein [Lachnoclostridium sp.]HCL01103.1 hypothetical protein [Lachnoclostridium phytofermentans]
MENTKLNTYEPLLPYDITYGEAHSLYDNMAYVCDPILCNKSMVHMVSGNIIKFYEYLPSVPLKIGGV